ncbi:bacillithiol biosynthesis cysteine-adding enzyme BshC [Sediminibacillus halophilus]|uniref:Putative cysteine ligase BshC n=1 Tax=Sediminibacillus halophilus TaxID=482461 RepID=A0A1G9MSA8_9BACI|nr:bacillithiol biosynthesis cysteine-adding enzyme BshC [Sediminibacillus halophilus]SDL77130.1 bacillithiol biosynthesis cysteine-adding enzyme BshC [Sediminibacillus halophilus]
MRIDPIETNIQTKLIAGYRSGDEAIQNKFDYQPFQQETYVQRARDISDKQFNREGLSAVLTELNAGWGGTQATMHNIERLKDENSMVIVGGQQAGLLTGPLYTIHKIISIINFAKEQEHQLEKPVIPVFWIAGEDHDFDEIDHIMMPQGDRMKKNKVGQRPDQKCSVSDLPINHAEAEKWLKKIFSQIQETDNTRNLYSCCQDLLQSSGTYVDFFAKIILRLFGEDGIVLVDSGNPLVRKLESDNFLAMIENQSAISRGVYQEIQKNRNEGYPIELDAEPESGHLFYHLEGERERVLLFKQEGDKWAGKQNECSFTTAELRQIALEHPEKLSNNVVTRPLMQELLFPTLAFFGGPGEVAYWSVLKPAFHALQIKMPPVLPRLSFTLVDKNTEKIVRNLSLTVEEVLERGVNAEKTNWLAAQTNPPIEMLAAQVKKSIEEAHRPLRKAAGSIRTDLKDIADKNLEYLYRDIDFIEERINKTLQDMHRKTLEDYDSVNLCLYPERGLQERAWNALPWINHHGKDFIRQLTASSFDYSKAHYIVYL